MRRAMARSVCASGSGVSALGSRNVISSVRSSTAWTDCTKRLPAPQADATSAAVTGVPSENCALGRSMTIQARALVSNLQESASPGTAWPSQSTRTSVSYNWRNSKRSLSFEGYGAWDGSTGSLRATVPTASPGSEINAHAFTGSGVPDADGGNGTGRAVSRGPQPEVATRQTRTHTFTWMDICPFLPM